MINVSKQENGVLFTFTNSDKYLYGSGTIEVPFNSLSIIQDESDNITLRKSASNDIFLSARYDTDFGYASKEAAVEALKEILYDEAGISEEEVQQMIDAATSGIPSSEVIEQLRTDVNTISGTVSSHTANTEVHVTQTEKNTWNGKVDEGYVTDYAYSKNQIDGFLENATTLLQTISGEVDTKVDTTTYESGQYATAQALNALQENKLDASAYTPTDLSEYWTSAQTQSAIDAATSGIPSSQVIEQLRTDVNTISGATENLNDRIDDIWDTIDEKEEVIASALTQLNQDVSDIDAKEEVIASALTEVRQRVDKKPDIVYVDFWGMFNDSFEMDDAKWNEMVEAYDDNAIFYAIPKEGTETNASPLMVDYQSGIGFQFRVPWGGGYTRLTLSRIEDRDGYEYVVSDTEDYYFEVDTTLDSGSTNPVQNAVITQTLNNKLDASAYTPTDLSQYWTSAQTQNAINAATSGIPSSQVIEQLRTDINTISGDVENKQDALTAGTGISISNNVISTSGVVMSQNVTQLVKLTQAAYDNLATKDSSTLYIISD